MPQMPPTFRLHGSRSDAERTYDRERGTAHERGYDRQWQSERLAFLDAHPCCMYCKLEGRDTPSELVDHLYPHRGNRTLFWLRALWVPSCRSCHDGMKQSVERAGVAAIDGLARRLGLPTLQAIAPGLTGGKGG